MEESQLAALDGVGQQSSSPAGVPDTPGISHDQRQLAESESRAHDGESDHLDVAERLLFWLDGKPYSAALTTLREALPSIPKPTALPFSPPWLIGLFPLRTELVTLIDPRPFLANERDTASANGHIAHLDNEQALLIGETGRLIAFVVDGIDDITSVSALGAPLSDEDAGRRDIVARYVEYAHEYVHEYVHPLDGEGRATVFALNLTALYEDVMGELEVWSRDA